MPPPVSLAGRVIDKKRIKLLQLIGSGGYGAVYHAVHLLTGAEYAVKAIAKRDNPGFRRELCMHKAVSGHPNVVTIHQILESAQYIYIVLDYCPGGDLFAAVTDKKSYAGDDNLIRSVFLQLLDAIEYCHSKGIYHRDLKPENILCNKDSTKVFLMDFGLATDSYYSRSFGCGSTHYMAPECIGFEQNDPYCPKTCDIWSLGIILINLIVGRNPWSIAIKSDNCYKAFLDNRNFLRDMLPLSSAAHKILAGTLAINPKKRISLAELRREIIRADTFYMSINDISKSSLHVREAAVFYGPLSDNAPLPDCFLDDDGSDESSDSDSDSDGPVTPEYKPIHLNDDDIHDMLGGEGIGELLIKPGGKLHKIYAPRAIIPDSFRTILC